MGAALIGFFSSLPEVLKLVSSVWSWLQSVTGNDAAGFIKEVGAAFDQLNAASSTTERENAAQSIAKIIAKL